MWNRIRHIVLFFALCCFSLGVHAQKSHPPEPGGQKNHQGGPCGQGNGNGLETPGGGSGRVPPPVGLCLPINDYLVPLLVVGIMFGAYKVRKIQDENRESATE